MAAVTKGLSRRPSQIEPFIAVLVTILSMEVMAGDACHPPFAVEDHIRGDLHGRNPVHRMRPHFVCSVMTLMAGDADITGLVAERCRGAGQGKMLVTFDAGHLEQTVMGGILACRGDGSEQSGQYEDGGRHILKTRILSSRELSAFFM